MSIAQKFKSEYNAEKLRLLYSCHYTWGISTLGWEGKSILAIDASLEKKAWSWPWDSSLKRKPSLLAFGCVRCKKECWLPLSPPWTFGSSWQKSPIGLSQAQFYQFNYKFLTYYSRKQGLNNGPILLLFYFSLIHLFKSSHLLWPMWSVWEAHVGLGHLGWSPIGSFWACPLLLGLLVGLGLEVHVGHGLGLEHYLGLGVSRSYKPCWDHIKNLKQGQKRYSNA